MQEAGVYSAGHMEILLAGNCLQLQLQSNIHSLEKIEVLIKVKQNA